MSTHESVSVVGVPVTSSVARRERRSGRMTLQGLSFAVAGAAFAAVIISNLVDFGTDDLRVALFNADSDGSWSHLLTIAILVVATGVAVAGARRRASARALWTASAGILAFIAVDEISSLHTRIDTMSWGKLVYAPILLALCVCLWRLSDRTARSVTLRVGLVVLLVAFGIHVFGPHIVSALGFGQNSWPYQIKVSLKEGSEIAGWILVLGGLAQLVMNTRMPDAGGRSERWLRNLM